MNGLSANDDVIGRKAEGSVGTPSWLPRVMYRRDEMDQEVYLVCRSLAGESNIKEHRFVHESLVKNSIIWCIQLCE